MGINLVSCDNCGVVLDASKLDFPDDIYRDDGGIDTGKATWDGDDYVPFVKCPVCQSKVLMD